MRDCQEGNGKFKRRGIDQKPSAHALILRFQKRLVVFDVGGMIPRIRQKAMRRLGHPERSRRGGRRFLEQHYKKPAESKFPQLKSVSDEQRKPRGACTPKGSPTSLIYPYTGKLTSFVMEQYFSLGREHRAHCSIDMLGIGSALYKTPPMRRFGTLGVKQADSQ